MNLKSLPALLLILFLLVACAGSVQIPISVNPIPTQSPIASPIPTAMPIPTTSVGIGMAIASKVVQLASFGDPLLYHLSYSPDGKWLVVTTSAGIKFYDAASLAPIQPPATQAWAGTPIFSPDGKSVAFTSGKNDTVTLLDVATGNTLQTLSGQPTTFNGMAFSPDGKTLATTMGNNNINLWDVASGKTRFVLSGHADLVILVVFSPDGKTLASTSYDKTIKLWNVATGQLLNTLSGHTDSIFGAVFTPDG